MSLFSNIISKGKNLFSKLGQNASRELNTVADIKSNYDPATAAGYLYSGGTGNPARQVNNFLQKRNLPGQVISNAIATKMENSPQYMTNQSLSRGIPITPLQQRQTREQSMTPVLGTFGPSVKKPMKLPYIDPGTERTMVKFIDYQRLKQPTNLALEAKAAQAAEGIRFPFKMAKTKAGLANQFDTLLTLIRSK